MTKSAKIHRLAHVKRDRGYRFVDRDPDMEYLCNRIAVEKNPLKLEQLALELNDLVSPTLKSVQAKPKRKKGLSNAALGDPTDRIDSQLL